MCGIAGILSFAPGGRPDESQLASMAGTLRHRGPDGNGTFVAGDIGLAHTRLAIVDLTGGAQPMHTEDGTLSVVFNGEIFNHVELRHQLEARGHRFRTRSDTEVILHAYREYGLDLVQHFNGQWAFALWDEPRRRLVLSRDRFGVRPLYYMRTRDRLVFASEVKAIAALPNVRLSLEPRGIAQVLHSWGPIAPATPFTDVSSLPPGHTAVVENGDMSVRPYWDWRFPADADAFPERPIQDIADELRALLIDAVRLRLRADVPVGAYLSGGLDSSIVTAIVKRYTETPLRTFSVTFEDPELDESRYQTAMIQHLGARNASVRCPLTAIARHFPRTIWHTEAPLVRTAPTPLMLLSRSVRAHGFKVVLTGEGADEVFGGYDLFKEASVRRFWARRPNSRLRPALLARLYPYLQNSPTSLPAYAESFFGQGMDQAGSSTFAHGPRWATTKRAWRFFSADMRERLGAWDPAQEIRDRLPAEIDSWSPLSRDQYVEAHTLLSSYLLSSQGDRVAMANSVEGRFPFLDYRVVEFANGLPSMMKLFGLKEKFVLKKALGDLLPDAIKRRPKQPYRAPDSRSFFRDGRATPYVDELLSPARLRAANLFDANAVGKLVEKCRAGRAAGAADNQAFVGVLSTMLADELFVRRTAWADISADAGVAA